MLSIYTLKSASEASTYYQQGDYSTVLGANEGSQWFGKGAELLNLKGPVDMEVFEALLEGRLPNGIMMNNTAKGLHHRPGYDLTFSAPKSVAILIELANSQEVREAWEAAVLETLQAVEQQYAATRRKDEGVNRLEKTGNFTFALFKHAESRAGDPGTHVHSVLMNMTLSESKEEWLTIFGDYLYRDKLLIGLQERACLARNLMNIGLELEFKPKGLFEIKGFGPLIEVQSKRSQAIRADLEERGESGGKAASYANLRTRAPKTKEDPSQRQAFRLKEAEEVGFSLEKLQQFIKDAKARGPIPLPDPAVSAGMALEAALEHIFEFLPACSVPHLMKTAGRISICLHNPADFLKIIEAKIKDGSLLYRGQQLVSPQRLALEGSVAQYAEQRRPVMAMVSQWLRPWSAQRVCDGSFEVKALVALLGSTESQVQLKANANQGLEALVKGYCRITQSQGAYPRILCQRTQDVEALKAKVPHQPVHSIEGFLSSCAHRIQAQKPIYSLWSFMQYDRGHAALDSWIVLGDITLGQVERLQKAATSLHARLIFASVAPSHTHAFLEELKMPLITVACQDNGPKPESLVKAFEAARDQSQLREIEDPNERLKEAIHSACGSDTLAPLVVLTSAEALKANQALRKVLCEQGKITGPVLETGILRALSFSSVQKSEVHTYQIGDVLCFDRSAEKKSPLYARVEYSCIESSLLELNAKDNALWDFKPSENNPKTWTVFRVEPRALQVGDQIQWTRTLKTYRPRKGFFQRKNLEPNTDRIKGETARVASVDVGTQNAVLILRNGVEIHLDLKSEADQHWDYGYATPLHQASSQLAGAVLLLDHRKLDDKGLSFLHQANSQGSLGARIVCSNLEALSSRILQGTQAHSFEESVYHRKEALATDQTLNTHLLFPGLEKAYLEAKGSNPAVGHPLKQTEPLDLELRLSAGFVDRACVGAFEREAVLSFETLKAKAAVFAGAQVSFVALDRAFEQALKEGWLHKVGTNEEGNALLSARHILLIEKRCRASIVGSYNQVKPIEAKHSETIQALKKNTHLTEGQRAAVELILTTPHRLVAVQGIAGSGKTTALNCIREHAERRGFTPLVFANVSAAAEKARESGSMQAMTTAQFLSDSSRALRANPMKARLEYGHRLLLLDEASMVSTDAFLQLITVVTELGCRLTVMGDFKQQGSIRWGIFFHDLMAYGIKTAVMRENVRLKNRDAFKILQATYAGNISEALKHLGSRLVEIPDKNEARQFIIETCQKGALSRQRIVPVVPGNEDRRFINEGIRAHLMSSGQLQATAFETPILVPVDRLESEKKQLSSYQLSDILRFSSSPHHAIQAGTYLSIERIEAHRLVLKSEAGHIAYWSPKDLADGRALEIYQSESRAFSLGERVVFTRNQHNQGLINGKFGTLIGFEGNRLRLELQDRCVSLDLKQRSSQHFDHSYALTTCKIQGQEEEGVLAYGETPKPYERASRGLRVGDEVTLSRVHTGEALSKRAMIQETARGSRIHLVSESNRTAWGPHNTPALFEYQKGRFEMIFFQEKTGIARVLLETPSRDLKVQSFFKHHFEKGSVFLKEADHHPFLDLFRQHGCTLKAEIKLELVDENKKTFTVFTAPDSKWSYFKPFTQRNPHEIPKSSTQQALLVQTSRGANVIFVTPHVGDFQKCVELQAFNKRSAASFHDPHWEALHKKVESWVAAIESQPQKQAALQAELATVAALKQRDEAWKVDPQRPDYDKKAWAKVDAMVKELWEPTNSPTSVSATEGEHSAKRMGAEGISKLIGAMREAVIESHACRVQAARPQLPASTHLPSSNTHNTAKALEVGPGKESSSPVSTKKDKEPER